MADDPYSKYLGLPPGKRPPKAHELLALPPKPTDPALIDQAAARCMDRLDRFALSNDRATRTQVQQLMNEVAKARTRMVERLPKDKPAPKTESKATPPAGPQQESNPQADHAQAELDALPLPSVEAYFASTSAAPIPAQRATPAKPSTVKPAIIFWSLIGLGWAVSLAVAFVLTYNVFKPEPLPSLPPADAQPATSLAATLPDTAATEPAPPIEPTPPDVQREPPVDEPVVAPELKPEPEPEPVGPTAEEIAAEQAKQERLEQERQRLERERLARERQRQEQARREAERKRQAELKRQEQEAERQEQLAKQKRRDNYFAQRDRLKGEDLIRMIADGFAQWNDGHRVELEPEFENGVLVGLKVSSVINQHQTKLADLTPLKNLPLRRLEITGRHLKTLGPLQGMALEKLVLNKAESLSDIDALKGMPLTSLSIAYAPLEDLKPLAGMPLKELRLNNLRKIKTTAPLEGARLASIHISQCPSLTDIKGLESMRADELKAEFYGNTNLSDITSLRGLKFSYLKIKECDDLKSLEGMQRVTVDVLELDAFYLKDLSPLKETDVTHMLKLGGSSITDLTPLSRLRCKHLTVDCSSLRYLKGIESMPRLQSVRLYNPVPENEVKRLQRAKPDLEINLPR